MNENKCERNFLHKIQYNKKHDNDDDDDVIK